MIGKATGEQGEDRSHGSTVSTGDGGFRIDLPDSFGGWLQGQAESYSPVRLAIWSTGPGELPRTVVLSPLAGPVRVTVSEVFSKKRAEQARVVARLTSPEPGDEETHFECLTDISGQCLLRDLPAQRRIEVMASKRGHFEGLEHVVLDRDPQDLSLSIIAGRPTLPLEVLTAQRMGIPGARVQRPDGMTVTTDGRGRVWMPVIEELVNPQVTVSATGFRSRKVTIANDGSTQSVELDWAPTLSGVVLDLAGDPLPGVHISLQRSRPRSTRAAELADEGEPVDLFTETAVTNGEGFFEVSIPDEKSSMLIARRQGFLEWSRRLGGENPGFPDYLEITLQPYSSGCWVRL